MVDNSISIHQNISTEYYSACAAWREIKTPPCGGKFVAGLTGLEPATFCVTGRRSKPAELQPQRAGHILYCSRNKCKQFFIKNKLLFCPTFSSANTAAPERHRQYNDHPDTTTHENCIFAGPGHVPPLRRGELGLRPVTEPVPLHWRGARTPGPARRVAWVVRAGWLESSRTNTYSPYSVIPAPGAPANTNVFVGWIRRE